METRISTRPDCPACKQGSLTGTLKEFYKEERTTVCENPQCRAIVYLDKQQKVLYAQKFYYPEKG